MQTNSIILFFNISLYWTYFSKKYDKNVHLRKYIELLKYAEDANRQNE
jgi:hypothetical protein